MKGWEVVSALVSSALFAWGGLIAQANPAVGVEHGPNVEAWVGTGGSLGILGALLYYLITKHNPRQDERYDKLIADNAAALGRATDKFHDTLNTISNDNNKNIDKLVESVNALTQKITK
jgi:hypothetical protein